MNHRYSEVVDFHDLGPTGQPTVDPGASADLAFGIDGAAGLGPQPVDGIYQTAVDNIDQDILQYLQI